MMASISSGNVRISTEAMPAFLSARATAGPDTSSCSPLEQRSLTVNTTARVLMEKF
jgi:hypothetical protein